MEGKWLFKIGRFRAVRTLVRALRSIKPPGFQGLSLWYVSRFFMEAIWKGAVPTRAAAISFRLFLAFFPGIILLLTLIPYIPIPDFQQQLLQSISEFFPGYTFTLFESTLDDLINKRHSTLLSVGFILTMYYASSSINAILLGFSESYHLDEKDNPLLLRLASVVLIFVLGIFLILAVTMMIFSGAALEYLNEIGLITENDVPLLNFAQWLISVFLVYTVITTLYNVGMSAKSRKKWRFFNAGATFGTLFFIIASVAFAYFVNHFATYNKLYGSLGTLLLLLIWLNFNCMILLIGFELNTSIEKAKKLVVASQQARAGRSPNRPASDIPFD
jgi:membrane protein